MSFSDMDKDAKALESDEENKNISHDTIKYNGKDDFEKAFMSSFKINR